MNKELLARFTGPIDEMCIEAAHSGNEHDVPCVSRMLDGPAWSAERDLGYDHELAGEVNGDCWEDSRLDYWYPKFMALVPPAETFEEKVALALALHRGCWYLERVTIYGAEKFDPKTFVWPRGF